MTSLDTELPQDVREALKAALDDLVNDSLRETTIDKIYALLYQPTREDEGPIRSSAIDPEISVPGTVSN